MSACKGKMGHILLIHKSESPGNVIKRLSKGQGWQWLYLGRDTLELFKWEKIFLPNIQRISVCDRLQDIAWSLRKPFLNMIAEMGQKHNSLAWWVYEFSERNTTSSALFLNCCYLKLTLDIIRQLKDNLCIISDSHALLFSIAKVSSRDFNIEILKGQRYWRSKITYFRTFIRRLLSFIYKNAQIIKAAGSAPLMLNENFLNSNKKKVLIHTFIEASTLPRRPAFKERYFGKLPQWLKDYGYEVVFLPLILGLNKDNQKTVFKWLANCDEHILIKEQHLKVSDLFMAIFLLLPQLMFYPKKNKIESMDISLLVKEEWKTKILSHGALHDMFYYLLFKRLRERKLVFDHIIYIFENMMWEKALLLGARKYLPGSKTTAFQHTALTPFHLHKYISKTEAFVAPIADKIICNGTFFKDILKREGLPEEKLFVGSALRFEHLRSNKTQAYLYGKKRPNEIILVVLPLEEDATDEFLLKVYDAFASTNLDICIKRHPSMTVERARLILQGKSVPQNMRFVEGTMSEWLVKTRVMISIQSTAFYEALVLGVPILRVGRETDLDFSSLKWFPEFTEAYYDPDDIRARTTELLHINEDERKKISGFGRQLLDKCFAPVTEEGLRVFVE